MSSFLQKKNLLYTQHAARVCRFLEKSQHSNLVLKRRQLDYHRSVVVVLNFGDSFRRSTWYVVVRSIDKFYRHSNDKIIIILDARMKCSFLLLSFLFSSSN